MILAQLKDQIGNAWASWSGADQQLAATCCADAATLSLQAAVVAASDTAGQAALAREKQQINAQMGNLQAAAELDVEGIIWSAVGDVLGAAIDFAVKSA